MTLVASMVHWPGNASVKNPSGWVMSAGASAGVLVAFAPCKCKATSPNRLASTEMFQADPR